MTDELTTLPTSEELYEMFRQINLDCIKTGGSVVAFTEQGYYRSQLWNIYGPNGVFQGIEVCTYTWVKQEALTLSKRSMPLPAKDVT